LIDGTGAAPLPGSFVFIRGGRFTDISTIEKERGVLALARDVKVVDGTGKWIIPGLIDAHVHLDAPSDARKMTRWGVVAARVMSEDTANALKLASRSRGKRTSPDFYPAAPIFTAPGGWWASGPIDRNLNRTPATPDQARAAVRKARQLGTAEIKVMDDDMGWCRDPLPKLAQMSRDVLGALISEARSQGMRVTVHAPQRRDAVESVALGASVLAHGILDDPVTAEDAEAMKRAHLFFVPTLDIFDFLADARGFMERALSDSRIRDSLSRKTLARYRSDAYFESYREKYPNSKFVSDHLPILHANLRRLREAGVDVALGTDMWAFPGAGIHLELEDFVAAGFSPVEAIRAATLVSARSLGEGSDRGSIEAGKRADFLILENDPVRDIRNTRSIESVYKNGRPAWNRFRSTPPG
jgi:imidazolonepropionase-like amidohydrolase